MLKRCKKCGIPESYRTTRINNSGICNLCESYSENSKKIFNYKENKKLLMERLKEIKKREGEYDCLLGISGGKDSSYVLNSLINDYGLKVYTFTFDNRFLTEKSRENIDKLIKIYDLDHDYFLLPEALHKKIYKESLKNLGYTCLGCALIAYISTIFLAIKKEIPLVFHGRSTAQMFKEFGKGSSDPFLPFVNINLNSFNPELNREMTLNAFKKAEKLLKKALSKSTREELFSFFNMDPYNLSAEEIPEFLGYFIFHPYNEGVIKKETSYLNITTHGDCVIHDAAEYITKSITGCSVLESELATFVRQGDITLEKMEEELGDVKSIPDEALDNLCSRTDINRCEIDDIIKKNKRKYSLYKKYIKIKSRLHPGHRDIYKG